MFTAAGAGVKTNLLFFTRGQPTSKIWYFDLTGVKVRKKTPLLLEHFDEFFRLLKPGASMVYCVCSLEPEEGESQIASLLRRNPDAARQRIDPDAFGLTGEAATTDGDLRLLPYFLPDENPRQRGLDGFFIAHLRRAY